MNWRKWLDEFVLAGKGILLATKEKKFQLWFILAFLFFGTLINLLSGGFSKFELIGTTRFPDNLKIIFDSLFGVFGYNMPIPEWFFVFFLAILQGTLIGLIALLMSKKNRQKSEGTSDSANVEKAGIISGLIALGAGCPTCGTTLLTPLLGTIFSTGGLAISGIISSLVTWLAIIIAILSLKKIGEETYVIITNEKYLKKKEKREENP